MTDQTTQTMPEHHFFKQHLQNVAARFYDDNFQPRPEAIRSALRHKDSITERLKSVVMEHMVPQATQWLMDNGIREYSWYQHGSTANVLAAWTEAGRVCAIRVPHRYLYPDHDHTRINEHAIMHPVKDAAGQPLVFPYIAGSNIEILPIVPVIRFEGHDARDNAIIYKASLRDIQDMHGMLNLHHHKDARIEHGVLPDGSPLPINPDMVKRRSGKQPSAVSSADILREKPYMADLFWMRGDVPK